MPAIDPTAGQAVGGTETRAWLLARGLAAGGRDVVFVVRSPGDPFERSVEGVTVVGVQDRWYQRYLNIGRSIERTSRWPRIVRPSWSLLRDLPLVVAHRTLTRRRRDDFSPVARLLPIERAAVWVTFGVQTNSADVIRRCQQDAKPSVLMLGCDADVDPWFASEPERVTPYGDRGATCALILRHATRIVAQTPWQRDRLNERYGRGADVLPNPIDLDRWTARPNRETQTPGEHRSGRHVLWVGRAEPVHKRPQEAIAIARLCPEIPFRMVMNPADPATGESVRKSQPENVTLVDFVPPDAMPQEMAAAVLLLNTSATEGFPNTFLQAAAAGRPIVSQTVLADWLHETGSGLCGEGDRERTATHVRELWANDGAADAIGRHGREAVAAKHGLTEVADRFAAILEEAAAPGGHRRETTH